MLNDLAAHPWPARRWRTDLLLAFSVYAALAFLAILVARQPGTIATVWLANGATTALIVSAPAARAPSLLLAGIAGNLAANLAYGDPLGLSAAFLLPNAAEVALAVWLVRKSSHPEAFANDAPSFMNVALRGAALPPLLGATAGAAVLQVLGFAPFERVWLDWYVGAALGSITMLPLMLMLRALPLRLVLQRVGDWMSILALLAVPLVTLAATRLTPYPFVVLCVLLLLLAFSRPRVVTFAAAPLLVGTLAQGLGAGWYHPSTPDTPLGHAMVYLSALLVVLPAQLVAVVVARQRALDDMLDAISSRENEIVTFADMNGVYRWVSRSRAAYRGTPNADILGRKLSELDAQGELSSNALRSFEAARGGATVQEVVDIDFPVRGLRTMDVQVQPARDEEGRQIGVLTSATDITEQEARRRELALAAARLQASNHSLEQFVRIASHDLREPLNTIVQFTRLIEEGQAQRLDPAGRLYFAHVAAGAERMRRMLDDVLQFVRLDGETLGQAQRLDLDAIMLEVMAALRASIDSSQATVQVLPLGEAMGHGTLIGLVLQNLLSNALKFVAPGQPPDVRIYAERDAQGLTLTVQDQGIGIDPARQPELGEPFRRLHARRKYDGTGLGLAICKRIAQAHGGHISIHSVPGQGSRFALWLPAATAQPGR